MKIQRAHFGFTLIELLITLGMMAILIMIAAPSMERAIQTSSVKGHHRDFQAALAFSRGEALTRAKPISMCPSDDGVSCDTTNNEWSNGWLIFAEDGAIDGVFTGDDELLRVHEYDGNNTATIIDPLLNAGAALGSLSWNHRGFSAGEFLAPGTSATPRSLRALVTICPSDGEVRYARGVLMAVSGRAIATRDTDGDLIHDTLFEEDDGTTEEAELICR